MNELTKYISVKNIPFNDIIGISINDLLKNSVIEYSITSNILENEYSISSI